MLFRVIKFLGEFGLDVLFDWSFGEFFWIEYYVLYVFLMKGVCDVYVFVCCLDYCGVGVFFWLVFE